MTKKRFWYQYNKERSKCCHILKAYKFSLMICNYMDISSSLMLNFFRFLCAFLMNFVQICTCSQRNLASLFMWSDSMILTRETEFPVTALHSCVSFSVSKFDWNVSSGSLKKLIGVDSFLAFVFIFPFFFDFFSIK